MLQFVLPAVALGATLGHRNSQQHPNHQTVPRMGCAGHRRPPFRWNSNLTKFLNQGLNFGCDCHNSWPSDRLPICESRIRRLIWIEMCPVEVKSPSAWLETFEQGYKTVIKHRSRLSVGCAKKSHGFVDRLAREKGYSAHQRVVPFPLINAKLRFVCSGIGRIFWLGFVAGPSRVGRKLCALGS